MKAELLILGVLHRGNFHPYEIRRRLKNAMVECYTDVDVGTLYYAIRQLAKNGLVTAVQRERVKRGGVRTVYEISAAGRRRFQQLLNEQFARGGSVAETLYGAMLFLHLADSHRIAELLRIRISREEQRIREIEEIRKQFEPVLSTGGLHLLTHLTLQRRLDRKWLRGVLSDVEGGRVRDMRDPKRLTRGH